MTTEKSNLLPPDSPHVAKISKAFQDAEENPDHSKAFCLMPWIHLHLTQTGNVTPCCQTPWSDDAAFGNINRESVDQIWNGDRIKAFRQKLLRDEQDDRCRRCYDMEASGVSSLRQMINSIYAKEKHRTQATDSEGHLANHRPVYLDLRFSNLCNFKCRICGHHSSSKWYNDALALGHISADQPKLTKSVEDFDRLLAQLEPDLAFVEEVYFAGGEPLIMEEHYRFLNALQAAGNEKVILRYSTNFSLLNYKGNSILDIWKKFKHVTICASLDDQFERAEYQRRGQDWQQVRDNFERLRGECPHVYFMISSTISAMNAKTVCALHREWAEAGRIDVKDFWPNVLEQPEHFNIRVLPEAQKREVDSIVKSHIEWVRAQPSNDEFVREMVAAEFERLLNYMHGEDWSARYSEFHQALAEVDQLKGS